MRMPRYLRWCTLPRPASELIGTMQDVARLGGLTRERVSQIVKLVWLAPDIQIEILNLPPVSNDHFLIASGQ